MKDGEDIKYPSATPPAQKMIVVSARQEQYAAKTEAELIKIGKARGYVDPKYWAERVMRARRLGRRP